MPSTDPPADISDAHYILKQTYPLTNETLITALDEKIELVGAGTKCQIAFQQSGQRKYYLWTIGDNFFWGYWSAEDTEHLITFESDKLKFYQHLIPKTTDIKDLGSNTHKFRDLYLSGTCNKRPTVTENNTPQTKHLLEVIPRVVIRSGSWLSSGISWTELDLSAHVPDEADMVLLELMAEVNSGTGNIQVGVKSHNNTIGSINQRVYASQYIKAGYRTVICPMENYKQSGEQKIEYSTNWDGGADYYGYYVWLRGYYIPITAHTHPI